MQKTLSLMTLGSAGGLPEFDSSGSVIDFGYVSAKNYHGKRISVNDEYGLCYTN